MYSVVQPVPSMKTFKGGPGTTRVGIASGISQLPAPNDHQYLTVLRGLQCNFLGYGLHIIVCIEEYQPSLRFSQGAR